MKKVKTRTIETVIFIWATVLLMGRSLSLIRIMKSPLSNESVSANDFYGLMVFLVGYCIVSLLWILKAKKNYKGKDFLKSQVAILDEDERSYSIHYKASEEGMMIAQVLGIAILLIYVLLGNLDFKIESMLYCGAFLYTCYALTYYYKLKKLYFA